MAALLKNPAELEAIVRFPPLSAAPSIFYRYQWDCLVMGLVLSAEP